MFTRAALARSVRRDRVMQLIEWALLDGLANWGHAAIPLRHGQAAEDTLLAHVLSVPPGIENRRFGRFMTGATLDRDLMFTKYGKQLVGTQSTGMHPGPETLERLPSALRRRDCARCTPRGRASASARRARTRRRRRRRSRRRPDCSRSC
jgi:hypothetical protein